MRPDEHREHVEAVQRFVVRRVADPHLAADLTADVFLAAIDAAPSYRADRGAPGAWLPGIARNTSRPSAPCVPAAPASGTR